MRKNRNELLAEFVAEAKKREISGLITYGHFDPKKDTRILSVEAQDEVIDVLNYLRFFLRKFPDSYEHTLASRRLAFALYCALRDLEGLEFELNDKREVSAEIC